MDNEWQPLQPRKRCRFAEPSASGLPDLTSLLEEEWFLLMVFQHLVQHGLEPYRLVCRKWHDACKQFPVKLKRVGGKELRQTIHSFPNTVSVAMVNSENRISDVEFFQHMAGLTNLKSLKLHPIVLLHTGLEQSYFRSATQLTELNLAFVVSDGIEDMLASVDHLTRLTKLRMISGTGRRPTPHVFAKLKTIRELDTDFDLFTDKQGACFFPSLTKLTKLELFSDWKEEEENQSVMLSTQAICHHASSLEHLSLWIYSGPLAVDFSHLTSLTSLKTLEVERNCMEYDSFWGAFRRMPSLTKLRTVFWGYMDANVGESIAIHTGLKALDCVDLFMHSYQDNAIPLAPRMTQLTDLSISVNGKLIPSLGCLTQLVHLKLKVQSDGPCRLDALAQMPSLQTLDVEVTDGYSGMEEKGQHYPELILSSAVLSTLNRLKSLSLDLVGVDQFFFRQLATKRELTTLKFITTSYRQYHPYFLSQVNLLSNLEVLVLLLANHWSMSKLLSPHHLWKLKKLTVNSVDEELAALRRKFASLGQVLVNEDDSPWCRRLTR